MTRGQFGGVLRSSLYAGGGGKRDAANPVDDHVKALGEQYFEGLFYV